MAFCCLGSLSFSSHLLFCCLGLYSLSLSNSLFEVQVIPFFEIPPPLTFLPLHFSFVHVPSPQKSHWTVYLSSVNHSVTDLTPSLRFFQCNTIQFPLIFGNTNSLPFSPSLSSLKWVFTTTPFLLYFWWFWALLRWDSWLKAEQFSERTTLPRWVFINISLLHSASSFLHVFLWNFHKNVYLFGVVMFE